MLRQIRYFQSVVRNNSFSKAAEECHISQSAISQQIQALERDLGFPLLERANRRFTLTPAGEYFYGKSLILISDLDRLCAEAAKIARWGRTVLRLGCLRSYGGHEFRHALVQFSTNHPDVSMQISTGTHEELYDLLRTEAVDLAMSDQRRAFSDEYNNLCLTVTDSSIEIAARNPIALLPSITPEDLKNTPCILVASPGQRETEREYYTNIIGFQGEFLFQENLEEARLAVISGMGFLPVEGGTADRICGVARVPLFRDGAPIRRTLCAFWKRNHSNDYIQEFASVLKRQFEE